MTIGEKIKHYRKLSGMTQSELAERSGIHPVTIRKYETNKLIPKTEQIIKIANALGVLPCLFFNFNCKFRKD